MHFRQFVPHPCKTVSAVLCYTRNSIRKGLTMKYFIRFLTAAFLLRCLACPAAEVPQTCPLCGQRTVVEIVYGEPNQEMAERQLHGELIIGGCKRQEEQYGCIVCSCGLPIRLEKIGTLLRTYPGKSLEVTPLFLEADGMKLLRGWQCGESFTVTAVPLGEPCALPEDRISEDLLFGMSCGDRYFNLICRFEEESAAVFRYLKQCIAEEEARNTAAAEQIASQLKSGKPDWELIFSELEKVRRMPLERPFPGGLSPLSRTGCFADVKAALKRIGDRERFRRACRMELSPEMSLLRRLRLRKERLDIDPPGRQDPAERRSLIADLERFPAKEENETVCEMHLELACSEYNSPEELPKLEAVLEEYLNLPRLASPRETILRRVLLQFLIHSPERAIFFAERIGGKLMEEPAGTPVPASASASAWLEPLFSLFRNESGGEPNAGNRQITEHLFLTVYPACWETGDFAAAVRMLKFCNDRPTNRICGRPEEHLELVRSAREYFAFVRGEEDSPLVRALHSGKADEIEAVLARSDDRFLRNEAVLQLAELLLKRQQPAEAKRILSLWSRLPGSRPMLDLSDLSDRFSSRHCLLLTRCAIALNENDTLTELAFSRYTSPWAGEARRLGMAHLRKNAPESYQRTKAFLINLQPHLSHIILDFEPGTHPIPGKEANQEQPAP